MAPKSNNDLKKQTQDFDFSFLQSGFLLHHRRESNRQVMVQIADSKQVEKPSFLASKTDADKSFNGVNVDQIPNEIVGLDCKKAKKPVKVRFHPEVLKVAKRNESLARLVYKVVQKVIDEFLSQDWTIDRPVIEEIPRSEIDALRKYMLDEHINMTFNETSTDFQWKLTNIPNFLLSSDKSVVKKSKKRLAIVNTPSVKFDLHVHPIKNRKSDSNDFILKEINNDSHNHQNTENSNGFQQRVDLRFIVGNSTVHNLFAIDFQSFYPISVSESGQENEHSAKFNSELGILCIKLHHSGARPNIFYGQSTVSISGCQNKMIDCAQIRLETLRHHVRQDPTHHRTRQPQVLNECGPIATAFNNQTRVALFQLTNTNRPLQMSRFTIVPVDTNHHNVPVSRVNESKKVVPNRMLHVRVNDEKREKTPPKIENCSGSPSDSIDSGMPNSPAFLSSATDDDEDVLSPLPAYHPAMSSKNRFHFNATPHASPSVQPQFRTRSSSECLDMRQTSFSSINGLTSGNSGNGSSNSLSSNGMPLRSILKKPKTLSPGMGNTCIVATSNGMRRAPTRYVLARSVSECDPTGILAAGEELQLMDDVVSMEDLTVTSSSPLSVCAEVDEDDSNDSDEFQIPTAEQQSKKRVSFNEQVQARIYRSNSSIVAMKNKQDRKLRNRMRRRAESESSDAAVDPTDLIHVPTIPLCKLSAEEKDEDIEVDQKNLLNQRRDSTDSGMESPPQYDNEDEKMQVEFPKKVQRVISSDSAFGDEVDME